MPQNKYAIETVLMLSNTHFQLLQWCDLDEGREIADATGANHNIYMILERPRIVLDPDSVRIGVGRVSGTFTVQGSGNAVDHPFDIATQFDTKGTTARCAYPHTRLQVFRGTTEIADINFGLAIPSMGKPYHHLGEYRVAYIGQAQGRDRGRDAIDRLRSHETLIKVQAEISRLRPHNEVWLLLLDFEAHTAMQMGPESLTAIHGLEPSLRHSNKITDEVAQDWSQMVNVVEAALIRYFRPEYNSKLKNSFPARNHTSYSVVFRLDVGQLSVGLHVNRGAVRLYSDTVEADSKHEIFFRLDDKHHRETFLSLLLHPLTPIEDSSET